MTSDIAHAFDHPEARAAATQGAAPRDRISLRDHMIDVEIGAFQSERGKRQRVNFNVVVEVQPGQGPVADDVDRILSYDRIAEAIRTELEAERVNLLETLAERIAERILAEPQAMRVFVRIEKLDRGPGALGVEIVRTRGQAAGQAREMEAPAPHPRMVFLSNDAIASAQLPRWLDQLQAAGAPVILTVGLPDGARPHSNAAAAQRRIDLLAIEQNAWVLAGRDTRCIVVGSRTELDWAMKNGQMVVWAPSKVVLDTAHAPALVDGGTLALWLGQQLQACATLTIGAKIDGAISVSADTIHLPLD